MSAMPPGRDLEQALNPEGGTPEPHLYDTLEPHDQEALRSGLGHGEKDAAGEWMTSDDDFRALLDQKQREAEQWSANYRAGNLSGINPYEMNIDYEALREQANQPQMRGISEEEANRINYENLSWLEKQWSDYSGFYNYLTNSRENMPGTLMYETFGPGSAMDSWDDTWVGSLQFTGITAAGKVTFSTLNGIGSLLDAVGLIDKEAVTNAVPPLYYEWGQRPTDDFAGGNDVFGERVGPAGVVEPIAQFGMSMMLAYAATPAGVAGQLTSAQKFFLWGAVADTIAFEPQYGSAVTMLRESPWLPEGIRDSELVKFFDAKMHYENDDELLARAAMVVEGGVLGETVGGLLRLFGPAKRGVVRWAESGGSGPPMPGALADLAGGGQTGEMMTWVDQLPASYVDMPLSQQSQQALKEASIRMVGRQRKILDLINQDGMSAEEALIAVEDTEFGLKHIRSEYIGPAMAELMAPMFNTTPEQALGMLRTFEEAGGDLTRLILDETHIDQNQAMEMLQAGGLGARKQWTIERHAEGVLENSNWETKARKMGRAMAESKVWDDVDTQVNQYFENTPGLRKLASWEARGGKKAVTNKKGEITQPAIEGDPVLMAQRQQILDRAKSWKQEELRKALLRRPEGITGAPAFYRGRKYTPQAVEEQTLELLAKARDGLNGRYWYENSSRRVMELVGNNAEDAELFVQLLAITSPQNPVPNNWNHALQIWHAYKKGEPIHWDHIGEGGRKRGMNTAMSRRAHELLYEGKAWDGRKTNNFYIALMREVDPELFTQAGWMKKFGEDLPEELAVIDIHMMRIFGYATGSPSQQQFNFAEGMIRDIAERLNAEGWEGGNFTADQVQAMLWVEQKHRTETLVEWQKEVVKAQQAGKTPPPMPEVESVDFATVSDMRQTEVQVDYTPSQPDVLPGISEAPLEARAAYSTDMHAAMFPDGHDPLADVIGMTQPNNVAPGQFSPGGRISFDLPHTRLEYGTLDPAASEMLGDYLRGRLLTSRAPEMSSYRVLPGKTETRNGFDYPLTQAYSNDLRESLYEAIEARWGEDAFEAVEIHQSENGVSLVNLNTDIIPLKEWQEELHGIISEWHNSSGNSYGIEIKAKKPTGFTAAGQRVVHDWANDPGGNSVINGLSERNRDAIVKLIRDEIGPRTQAVNEHYARQGFGEPGTVNVGGTAVTADVDAARTLGHNGTLAQLIDDGVTVQGLARLQADGVTIINATAHADLTTGVHELGHALRNQLFNGRGQADAALQERLMTAFGVTDGVWTREAEEAFAEAWESLVIDGKFAGVADNEMAILAAYARDFYQEVKRTPMVGRMSQDMKDAMERLVTRQGLPIQWAPGKFLPARDWSAVVARAKQAEAEGQDWTHLIEPDDIIGTNRQSYDLLGGVVRDDLRFDLDTDEDMMMYMALVEDVTREVRNAGVGATRRSDVTRQAESLRLFNSLLGRGESQLNTTLREMMIHDFGTEELDSKIIAMNTALSVQLKRLTQLAKRAESSRSVEDYAMLQRQFLQFQMAQAFVQRVKSQTGRGLRAWGSKVKVPTWDEIGTPQGAKQFMQDLAFRMETGEDLARKLSNVIVPDDVRAAVRLVEEGATGPGRAALAMFQEVFINGLLSAPATFFSIALASPILVTAGQGGMKFLGAMMRRDKETMMEVFENAQRMLENGLASWQMAGRAFIKEESQLMPGSSLVDTKDQRAIRMSYEDNWIQRGINHVLGKESSKAGEVTGKIGAGAVNVTGRVARAPSNVIQFFDEGFRQMHARTHLQAKLTRQHREKLWDEHLKSLKPEPAILDEMNARGELWTPPTFTEAERRAWLDNADRREAVRRSVNEEMDTFIRNGQLRTRQVIVQEATNGKTVVTPEMAARNPDLVDVVGQPINSIEEPYVRGIAIYDYVDQNYTVAHGKMIQETQDYAVRAVFQNELEGGWVHVQKVIDAVPFGAGRLVMPFVRTPINIMRSWGGLLPTSIAVEMTNRLVGGVPRAIQQRSFKGVWELDPDSMLNVLHSKTMDDIMSGDPVRMAEARGRQAGGLILFASAYTLAETGMITGGGPKSGDRRRALMDSGWRPYSFYIPGYGYVSYMRADPYSQTLALVADTIELLESENLKGDYQEKLNLVQALLLSTGQQLSEKTFMQGIGDLIAATQDPERGAKFVQRMQMATTMPYSSLQRNLMDIEDPALREMRSLVDARAEQSFLGNPEGVAPSRNILGETRLKFTRDSAESEGPLAYLNMLNIMRWSSESKDPVYLELAKFDVDFRTPPETLQKIQLTMFTREGYPYTAHDEWMERIGTTTIADINSGEQKTLRQALEDYISPDGEYHEYYSGATNIDPKTGYPEQALIIKGIIARYHAQARAEVVESGLYPELSAILNDRRKAKKVNEKNNMERLGAPQDVIEEMERVIEAMP